MTKPRIWRPRPAARTSAVHRLTRALRFADGHRKLSYTLAALVAIASGSLVALAGQSDTSGSGLALTAGEGQTVSADGQIVTSQQGATTDAGKASKTTRSSSASGTKMTRTTTATYTPGTTGTAQDSPDPKPASPDNVLGLSANAISLTAGETRYGALNAKAPAGASINDISINFSAANPGVATIQGSGPNDGQAGTYATSRDVGFQVPGTAKPGTYQATLQALDQTGNSYSATLSVTITAL